jgi:hypothetical protein
MMTIDWEKLSAFVQAVGVPFAVLLLFVGPFVFLIFTFVKKYGARIAESHINFMESSASTQEKNADTLSRLESTVASKHIDHTTTHHAIGLVAQAGIHMLDEDPKGARSKLERVNHVLSPSFRGDDKP